MESRRQKAAKDVPAPKIQVERIAENQFSVSVTEGNSQSLHQVTLREDDIRRLAGENGAEELVRRSFEFLLEREPKESILADFELGVIQSYFPEYERIIRPRL
jgi:hypothetical protein